MAMTRWLGKWRKAAIGLLTGSGRHPTPATAAVSPLPFKPGGTPIAAWGDSLTAYGLAEVLAAITGRQVYNGGGTGHKSTQIAARQGAIPATLTLEGNTLPAAGTVGVSWIHSCPINSFDQQYYVGTLVGVVGQLQRVDRGDGAKAYLRFERVNDGREHPVPEKTAFIPLTDAYRDWIASFWIGRKNFDDPEQVFSDIAACVAHQRSGLYLVLSLIHYDHEPRGSKAYEHIMQMNRRLQATYGERYLDVRSLLVAAYDPTDAQDLRDHEADITPSSLRIDEIHLSPAGQRLVAQAIADRVEAFGW